MPVSPYNPQAPSFRANLTVALLLLLAAGWGLWPALHGVHHNWSDKYGHFSHGYLVLGMALWLAWRCWREHVPEPSAPTWLAIPLLAVFIVAMAVSVAVSIETFTQSLLPLVLLASISAVYGWRTGRRYFWPIFFLYTALPVWWLINTPLQELTAFVANVLVRWTGIPAFVEGNSFHLPAGVVHIAAGCSGLAYLNSAVALALFQALQYLHSWRDRLKLLTVAVVLALAFNWLRVYSLIVIAYASDMQNYLIRVDHLTYGWILFAFCIWPVFWYGVRLERRQGAAPASPAAAGNGVAGPWQAMALAGTAVAALLLVPAALERAIGRGIPGNSAGQRPADGFLNNWLESEGPLLNGAEESQLTAIFSGQPVWVYRAWDRGMISGHWPLEGVSLLGSRWESDRDTPVAYGAVGVVGFQQRQGRLRNTPVLMRSGLRIGGTSVHSNMERKLALLQGVWRLRQDALLWLAITPCAPDCATAAKRLDLWIQESGTFRDAAPSPEGASE